VRRGEVWRVLVLGRSERVVVVVGQDQITAARDDVLCVHIDQSPGLTGSLLAVPIDQPVTGYARAVTVGPLLKKSFVERLGELDDTTQEQLDIALRAALDL
jgi:mRNA-degrading endonuclease toxin of MazEF toxin-antitoxin module